VILQGDICMVRCPYCGELAKAIRLTPFASKLKCLNCYSWVEEEAIKSDEVIQDDHVCVVQ